MRKQQRKRRHIRNRRPTAHKVIAANSMNRIVAAAFIGDAETYVGSGVMCDTIAIKFRNALQNVDPGNNVGNFDIRPYDGDEQWQGGYLKDPYTLYLGVANKLSPLVGRKIWLSNALPRWTPDNSAYLTSETQPVITGEIWTIVDESGA